MANILERQAHNLNMENKSFTSINEHNKSFQILHTGQSKKKKSMLGRCV